MPCISRTLAVLVLAAAFVLASPVRRDDTAFLQCLIEKTQGKLSNGEAFSTVQSFQNDVKNNEMLGKIWAGCCQKSDENESNLRTGNPFEAGDKQNGGHEHDQLAAQEQNLKAPQGQATVDHFQGDAFRPLDPKLAKLEDVKKKCISFFDP
ncbi:hypothetical protein C8F01DRAFT_1323426 [Mycena amicta]|nr:hypothetical protein C8F01DRAFT_1323426 [Mycena amicta]